MVKLKRNFKILDCDADGVINKEDIKSIYKLLGEEINDEAIDELMRLHDQNENVEIDFEEFC